MTQAATPWIEDPNGPTSSEKCAAMWIHLCMLLNNTILPIIGIIAAIIVWRVDAAKSEFVNRHGWAAANLIISGVIYVVIMLAVFFGLGAVAAGLSEDDPRSAAAVMVASAAGLWVIAIVYWLVTMFTAIIGIVRASSGKPHRYFHALPLVVPS